MLSLHIQDNFAYPGKFPYPGLLHEFLHVFIPGLPYPGNFPYHGKYTYPGKYTYHVISLYPVKASIRKSDCYKKINISSNI